MSNIINDNSIKETYIPLFILEEKAKMKQCSQKYIECICKEEKIYYKECIYKYENCVRAINSDILETLTF